ncbi:TraB/GumN family protein [Pedobacter nyackensis]|uniref:TraB/GumN family protein n=1 Tax=Pedobacter nyackensis TaxID=475255 RepID=UPI00292CCFEA|nr:TraB/GumN family protein [Pedobacter nyackensis]
MKTILNTIAVIATFLFTLHVKAQQKSANKSLLWEITGKGLTKPSYVYGTIHMICEPDFVLHDKTKKALSTADELVLELNFTDPAELADVQKTMTSPVPLSKRLSPAQYRLLDSVLALKAGIQLQTMDQLTLIALSSIAISKTLPCTEIKSYEFEFVNLAKAQHKSLGALETVKQQTAYFSKAYTDESLIKQIANFDDYKAVFGQLINAYKMEDLTKIEAILKDERFGNTEESDKWLLQVRNANWVKRMPQMMEHKSCFFAVGAGHLPGKEGVLQLLKAEGYTVKPIFN